MTTPDLERDEDGLVRLHKLLARAGVASRRKCEELMLAGEVTVDDEVVTRLGTKIDPDDRRDPGVRKRLPPVSPHVYLVLQQAHWCRLDDVRPAGASDPQSASSADRPERLFHVGRLDTDTAGLILLTNDGEFSQRMAPPVVRGRQDLRRRGRRARLPRHPRHAARRRGAGRQRHKYRSAATLVGRARATSRSWSWSSTRDATASCAACSTTSATRSGS